MELSDILHVLGRDTPASYWEFSDVIKKTSQELANSLVDNKYTFGYELITQELIQLLSQRIVQWLDKKNTLTVMEVGAGNGKLSLHLNRHLQSIAPGKVAVVAIDNGQETWGEKLFPIDKTTFARSVDIYKPDIVLCSRMPQYITPELVDRWSHVFDIEDYIYHRKKALNDMHNSDHIEQTSIRRTYPHLMEYMLIGPIHSCGDSRLSYGVKEFPPSVYDVRTMDCKVESKDIIWEEKPIFHRDGFLREELTDALSINIFDFLKGQQFTQSSSSIHSFTNIRFLDPRELYRLNTLHDKLIAYQQEKFANR